MLLQHLRFEFDPRKAASNLRKHGVSFDEAIATFYDTQAMNWADPDDSSLDDERFVNLGRATSLRLLYVVHNEGNGVIRIISARPATPAERALYEEL